MAVPVVAVMFAALAGLLAYGAKQERDPVVFLVAACFSLVAAGVALGSLLL